MRLILEAAQGRERGIILEDGCGVGMYLTRLARTAELAIGLEVERERAIDALALCRGTSGAVINSVGEELPFPPDSFDLILSHEVIEHVVDDRRCIAEIVRTLKPGGTARFILPQSRVPVRDAWDLPPRDL